MSEHAHRRHIINTKTWNSDFDKLNISILEVRSERNIHYHTEFSFSFKCKSISLDSEMGLRGKWFNSIFCTEKNFKMISKLDKHFMSIFPEIKIGVWNFRFFIFQLVQLVCLRFKEFVPRGSDDLSEPGTRHSGLRGSRTGGFEICQVEIIKVQVS